MKFVKEKEQKCWRENLIEMAESRNGSPRGLHGLKAEKSVAWVRIQAKPGGHSENSEKGSDGIISSVGLGYVSPAEPKGEYQGSRVWALSGSVWSSCVSMT